MRNDVGGRPSSFILLFDSDESRRVHGPLRCIVGDTQLPAEPPRHARSLRVIGVNIGSVERTKPASTVMKCRAKTQWSCSLLVGFC